MFFGRSNFGEFVLEEKLISRALLQDSEPSPAGNAISDVFSGKFRKKHGTGEESRGIGGREERVEDRKASFSNLGLGPYAGGGGATANFATT